MRSCKVYYNGILAGTLTEHNPSHYTFEYNDNYYAAKESYRSDYRYRLSTLR